MCIIDVQQLLAVANNKQHFICEGIKKTNCVNKFKRKQKFWSL